MKNLLELPDNLPVPVDDGACDHLLDSRIPSLTLPGVSGGMTDVGAIKGQLVLYFYPMNGRPDAPPLIGWNDIPGARGCTPQACAFRDGYQVMTQLGAKVFGISAQPLQEQQEAHTRLHLPFELLNDSDLALTRALRLPMFNYGAARFIKRLTLIAKDGWIEKVFYPVFPPDRNAAEVIDWLTMH